MITVNGWCAGGKGKGGDECSVNGGEFVSGASLIHLVTLRES